MAYKPYYLRKRSRETLSRLSFRERWVRDGLEVADIPGGTCFVEMDMTAASGLLEQLRKESSSLTWTSIFIKAAALAVHRLPDLHFMLAGNTRYSPLHSDIGVSVAGETFVAPTLVLQACEEKSCQSIADELHKGVATLRQEESARMAAVEKWGWIVPFAFLRRAIFRFLRNRLWFRLKAGATPINITHVPLLDGIVPLRMTAGVIITIGSIRDRAVVFEGRPCVRPTVFVHASVDHAVWDAMCTARFLREMKKILETPDPAIV
jgi:pyruvate/2-oxoglutarate dehydrogenase complex dihydrolipoamide acyltransferase (E2) component